MLLCAKKGQKQKNNENKTQPKQRRWKRMKTALDILKDLDLTSKDLANTLKQSFQSESNTSKESNQEPEVGNRKVKCHSCGVILEVKGAKLMDWDEWPGDDKRPDTSTTVYKGCIPCSRKEKAKQALRDMDIRVPKIDHELKKGKWFEPIPGFMPTRTDKEDYHRRVKAHKATTWLDRIHQEIALDIDNEDFVVRLELPKWSGDWVDAEVREIITIRTLIRIGRDYRDVYRGRKYLFRDYSDGKIAELYKRAKEGLGCPWCGGYYNQKFAPYTACGECQKEPKYKEYENAGLHKNDKSCGTQ